LQASAGVATGDGRNGELRAATYGRGIWQIPLLHRGESVVPAMTLSPTSLTFAAQAVSTVSAAQTITVTNSGNASLTITQIAPTGDFNETGNCIGPAIAVAQPARLQVEFQPTTTGTRTGVLTIYGNVAGGQATAALTGVGTTAATVLLDPITLSFTSTNVGAT